MTSAVRRVISNFAGVHILNADVVSALLEPHVIPSVQGSLVSTHRHHIQLLMEITIYFDPCPKTACSIVPYIYLIPYSYPLGIVKGKSVIKLRVTDELPILVFHKGISHPDGGFPDDNMRLPAWQRIIGYHQDVSVCFYHVEEETEQGTCETNLHVFLNLIIINCQDSDLSIKRRHEWAMPFLSYIYLYKQHKIQRLSGGLIILDLKQAEPPLVFSVGRHVDDVAVGVVCHIDIVKACFQPYLVTSCMSFILAVSRHHVQLRLPFLVYHY